VRIGLKGTVPRSTLNLLGAFSPTWDNSKKLKAMYKMKRLYLETDFDQLADLWARIAHFLFAKKEGDEESAVRKSKWANATSWDSFKPLIAPLLGTGVLLCFFFFLCVYCTYVSLQVNSLPRHLLLSRQPIFQLLRN
jgi:hypothetical protein